MATHQDRFLGKTFSYKGGTIKVIKNLGTIYEGNRAVFYSCKVLQATRDDKTGVILEMSYQALRGLLLGRDKTSKKKTAAKKKTPGKKAD